MVIKASYYYIGILLKNKKISLHYLTES